MVRIALVQMAMQKEKEKNLSAALDRIAEAAQNAASIVALPELFTSPYFPQDEKSDASAYADEIPGETSRILSRAAAENNIVLAAGSVFEKSGSAFYNTSLVFDEKGKMLGKYRKMHVPHDPGFYEQNYFSPGDLGYQVFETRHGRIAPLICYDQWFPEAARSVALMDADIIIYSTAIGLVEGIEQSEGDWQDAWTTVQRGHAIANNAVVAAANRVGSEGRMRFWGGSFVCSQFGTVLGRGSDKEEIVYADADLSLKKEIREGWRFFHNRRPESYGRITRV